MGLHKWPIRDGHEQFQQTIAINLRGSALSVKCAARAAVAKKVPRLNNFYTGSVASGFGANGPVPYTTSKHALLGLVRSAAGQLGKHGIWVNCVSPFGVATPLACNVHNQEPSEVEMVSASMSRLKGIILKAKNVAEAALFLV